MAGGAHDAGQHLLAVGAVAGAVATADLSDNDGGTTELAFEYVIRLRGDIYVTSAGGERRTAAAWVGAGGRARRLVGARVTDTYELLVGAVVCVQDPKMDEPWCLVASEATVPTRVLIRYYGKRWGIEAGFRDIKDMRFGMGLSSMHVSRPDRRDRLLLISALAIAVLSLLGAAGERIGYDRWLKANTVKRRTHSLFRQGLMLYHHLPNWPEDRIRPLMETFGSMLNGTAGVSGGFRRDLMLRNEGMHEVAVSFSDCIPCPTTGQGQEPPPASHQLKFNSVRDIPMFCGSGPSMSRSGSSAVAMLVSLSQSSASATLARPDRVHSSSGYPHAVSGSRRPIQRFRPSGRRMPTCGALLASCRPCSRTGSGAKSIGNVA